MRSDEPIPTPATFCGDDSLDRKLLSHASFAVLVGSSEASIKDAVSNGSLLAVQRTNSDGSIEAGVAGFQARPEIHGVPLARVLTALAYSPSDGPDTISAASAYMFFMGRNDLLGGLTPVEVLTGVASANSADLEVLEFLSRPHVERLESVVEVGKTTAQIITGWG
jgi:hypothetical protein